MKARDLVAATFPPAAEALARPEVRRWIAQLQTLAARMPAGLAVVVEAGVPRVVVRAPAFYETPAGAVLPPELRLATIDGGVWDRVQTRARRKNG